MKKVLVPLLLLVMPVFFAYSEGIHISKPTLYPESQDNKEFLDNVLQEAAFIANRLYEDKISVTYSGFSIRTRGEAEQYSVQVNAVNQPDSKVLQFTMTRKTDGAEAEAFMLMGDWQTSMAGSIAQGLFFMWGSFDNFGRFSMQSPPSYVEELPTDWITSESLPMPNMQLYPFSVAVKSNGNLLIAANMLAVEMDRNFKIIDFPGKYLVEQGNYTYAYGIGVTPGDTVYFRPSTGGEIYSLIPDTERPRKIRTGITGIGPFAVLRDGSAIVVDAAQKKAVRIEGRNRKELNLFDTEYSFIYTVAPSPEGNFWTFDMIDRRIRIYSPDGELIDSIFPLANATDMANVKALSIFENGDFVALTHTSLIKFRRNGEPIWKMDEIPGPNGGGFSMMTGMAADVKTGLIYLAEYTGRRIVKLLDVDYANQRNTDLSIEKKIIGLNEKLVRNPDDIDAIEQKALFYEENDAFEVAKGLWEQVFDIDPFNFAAEEKIDALDVTLLRSQALELTRKTLEILDELGPESARTTYQKAIQTYEKIFALDPADESKTQYSRLQDEFLRRQAVPKDRSFPLTVVSIDLRSLFPSLMQYYRLYPAGKITVKNDLSVPISNLRSEIFIKRYMDFPAEATGPNVLSPGEEAEIDLKMLFNDSVFNLEEDMPVQAQIKLLYNAEGEEQTTIKNQSLMLYRRTALSWDDTGKLAAFIMPNEEIISTFAHRVSSGSSLEVPYKLSGKFTRAVKICDALGSYDIEYVEDPESPISGILGNETFVDTVRFPRTTLFYRSGDCDDTTALLGSLLESSGINTAIMTSPGHVFLAFDTEEPEGNRWQYTTDQLETIVHNGTVWIPVETTIIREGFQIAWREASKLLQKYSDEQIEFFAVKDQRRFYPAMPLPPSGLQIVEPSGERIDRLFGTSIDKIRNDLYTSSETKIQRDLRSASGRSKVKLLNQLGILQARFGYDHQARTSFNSAITESPSNVSSYVNLANLEMSLDNLDSALLTLEQGKEKKPDSVLINLLMARALHKKGQVATARDHFEIVERRAPQLAESFAFIKEDSSIERASAADGDDLYIWDLGEEP